MLVCYDIRNLRKFSLSWLTLIFCWVLRFFYIAFPVARCLMMYCCIWWIVLMSFVAVDLCVVTLLATRPSQHGWWAGTGILINHWPSILSHSIMAILLLCCARCYVTVSVCCLYVYDVSCVTCRTCGVTQVLRASRPWLFNAPIH